MQGFTSEFVFPGSHFQPDYGMCGQMFEDWSIKRLNSVRVQKLLADPRYDCFYEVIKYDEKPGDIKDPRLYSFETVSLRVIFENDKLSPVWRGVELINWVALTVLTIVSLPFLAFDFFNDKDLCKLFYSEHMIRFDRVVKGKEVQIFEMCHANPRSHNAGYSKLREHTFEDLTSPGAVKILAVGDLLCFVWLHLGKPSNMRHPFITKGQCIIENARDLVNY